MRTIQGVGINDADYVIQGCPFYKTWVAMIYRCYSEKHHKVKPTYAKCTVSSEWHLFSNFRKWMISQDWKGKELDKDILVIGNKTYGPDKCLFVTKYINTLLTHEDRRIDGLTTGVRWCTRERKFISLLTIKGKQKRLGSFSNSFDAELIYREFRSKYIFEVAAQQTDPILRDALILHAEAIEKF